MCVCVCVCLHWCCLGRGDSCNATTFSCPLSLAEPEPSPWRRSVGRRGGGGVGWRALALLLADLLEEAFLVSLLIPSTTHYHWAHSHGALIAFRLIQDVCCDFGMVNAKYYK